MCCNPNNKAVAIVGGGPAGLMAAETALGHGFAVHLFDAMPSVGRKFLMAGKSGLNLTHAEPSELFLSRFGVSRNRLESCLDDFGAEAVRAWARNLGVETFVGSSGQVFPMDLKAAPLLRAWVRRLREAGLSFHMRCRWIGWDAQRRLVFSTPGGDFTFQAEATILALGGASWPSLGSDGAWTTLLGKRGVSITPLTPSNCGFDVAWSDHFRERFAGHPLKPLGLASDAGRTRGEIMITEAGIEGGGVYRHSAALRQRIAIDGAAALTIDLLPDRSMTWLTQMLGRPRGSRSLAEHLRRQAGLEGVKAGLLRECARPAELTSALSLATAIKALPVTLLRPRPIAEAISSAGGVAWSEIADNLMLRRIPGVFVAGEMLDWEVTTGGYLLTACMALGRTAGKAAAAWLSQDRA